MKLKLINIFLLLLVFTNNSFSQQTIVTTIDYVNGWQNNLDHTTCNIFNISPLSTINGYTHYPVSGGAIRAGGGPLVLKVKSDRNFAPVFMAGLHMR